MPNFIVFFINFLCLVAAGFFSQVLYYVINYLVIDILIITYFGKFLVFLRYMYKVQVEDAVWGRFFNIWLFIEIYYMLVVIWYVFVSIFRKEFFKKAML